MARLGELGDQIAAPDHPDDLAVGGCLDRAQCSATSPETECTCGSVAGRPMWENTKVGCS